MFFIASKVLAFFVSPFNWIIAMVVWYFFTKNAVLKKRLLLASFATLLFFSNPFIFHLFASHWEIQSNKSIQKAEIAVVLGGFASYNEREEQFNFSQSADRLLYAMKLYYDDEIQKVLISGGSGKLLNQKRREAETGFEFVTSLDFPADKILLEATSRNTHENAVSTKKILEQNDFGDRTILLITSAYHMPRAVRCFEKEGISVIPYPVDYLTDNLSLQPNSIIVPQLHIMSSWEVLLHEWIGVISYWLLGYI